MNICHENSVSLRKFASMTGTTDGGVRKAIRKGSISAGVIDGKILPSVASIEWGKPILENWLLADNGNWIEDNAAMPSDTHIDSDLYPDDTPPTPLIADEVYTGDEDVLNDATEAAEFLKDIPIGTSKIEAERIYSVLRARKVKRELQKLEGELVDKGLVYKNLFEFAAVICSNLKNVPDRVVDSIRASDTRNEGIKILDDEITTVLLSLSGVGEIKLTKED
jgi:hypothetical protein